ncbi:MAG TPA: hypothetical protein PKE64_26745 [Anaerolineae bacterium]|nr:hypothetical protein [Anaerolineae bacterium]HMR67625.1 hypothetical protein [Anaerolineae bacterium]
MPICRECGGTGQVEVKTEIMTRCPTCDSTKILPDGTECKRCNKWGEIGTGKFEIEKQLCKTCWGSGKVSEGSVTTWFLVRAVPTTFILLGGGLTLIWAVWSYLNLPWTLAAATTTVFGLWAGVMFYFVSQMPTIGEISTTNWFLIRAVPTTVSALPIIAAITWAIWAHVQNAPATAVMGLGGFLVWGVLMLYFISHLPE